MPQKPWEVNYGNQPETIHTGISAEPRPTEGGEQGQVVLPNEGQITTTEGLEPWEKQYQPPAENKVQALDSDEPGALESFGEALGLGNLIHPVQALKEKAVQLQQHPVWTTLESLDPSGEIKTAHNLIENYRAHSDNPAGFAATAMEQTPVLGNMIRAGQQAPAPTPGESYMGRVMDVATNPGAMGTVLGTSLPLALSAVGGADIASPGRLQLLPLSIGSRLQRAGAGIINKTVGATAKDFSRGANPGAAYLAGGGRPAFTMGGLAKQAIGEPEATQYGGIVGRTGQKLGGLYKGATQSGMRFPAADVRAELEAPLSEYEASQEAPGATGISPLVGEYRSRMMPPVSGSTYELQGPSSTALVPAGSRLLSRPPMAEAGFQAEPTSYYTPSDVFGLKRSIASQARWNPNEPVGLNAVRQEQVGRLGGMLTEQIPEAAPLNKIYQGALRLGNRAAQRAKTGQMPLTQIARRGLEAVGGGGIGYATGHPLLGTLPMLADTIPARSTAGWGLYNAGSLVPGATRLAPLFGPAGIIGGVVDKKQPNEVSGKQY